MSETVLDKAELLDMATTIVCAHVSNNPVPLSELPSALESVFNALDDLVNEPEEEPVEELVPKVPIKKSITPDAIICLEDGKPLKMLKRHLRTKYDMTPEEYRDRWSLPSDYPMVAPNYAAKRQELAKKNGLGRKPRK